jgi:2-methylcitrate dehydratase PrpD
MIVLDRLVDNLLNTPYEKIDEVFIEGARDRLVDVTGCILGGARASGCLMLLDLLSEWGGAEQASILVHGLRLPAHHAAFMNSVMARSYDFDPTGPVVGGESIPAHVSVTTVPAALAAAERAGASGKGLLAALVLGDDLASRIAAASRFENGSGFEPTGFANAFGAAAIAGRLWGLNEKQTVDAFGIVLNQLGGTFQNVYDGVHAFKLPQGLAAQVGLFAAALAGRGFTGVEDPLFGPRGYFDLYCPSPRPELLTHDLGTQFCGDMTRKPYPGCRINHSAIEGTLDLVRRYDLRAEDIDEVVVSVTGRTLRYVVGRPFVIRRAPEVDAAFNLSYGVASVILRRSIELRHFTEPFVCDPVIGDIVRRVRIVEGMSDDKPLGARVRIRTKEGVEHETEVVVPKGHGVLTPLSEEEKRQKFLNQAAFCGSISESSAEEALSSLSRIEAAADISGLINSLTPGKVSPSH